MGACKAIDFYTVGQKINKLINKLELYQSSVSLESTRTND